MENDAIKSMIDLMPSEPLANYAFHNRGENTFENKAGAWGLTDLTFSSGAAYGDLDNDGDLDLVVNNINDAFLDLPKQHSRAGQSPKPSHDSTQGSGPKFTSDRFKNQSICGRADFLPGIKSLSGV